MFAASLNRFKKAYTAYNSGDAAYDHWTPEEAKKLELAIAKKFSWLDANISRVKATLKTKDLPIKAAAFHSEQQVNYPTLPTSSRIILRSRYLICI
jgi:heat shock protein